MPIQKVLIAAGGTGGHLFPAQGFARELAASPASPEVLFVAGGLASNRYFDRARFSYRQVACSPIAWRSPLNTFWGTFQMCKGVWQSIAILKEYRPDVVVGFGSYYAIPPLLAARWLNIPIVLHEANSIPGKANQWLAPLAAKVGIHFPSTASYFKDKAVVVGLPLREGYQKNSVDKQAALAYYALSSQQPVLLVCGGSQGAQAINRCVGEALSIIQQLSLQVIHLTGNEAQAESLRTKYAEGGIPACVKAFESQMQYAWGAADAFIGRSGASTIAEALEFEVPGLLVPYPFATDYHQDKNADYFVETIQGGWKRSERELTTETFQRTIADFFASQQFNAFQEALKVHKQTHPHMTLSDLILTERFKEAFPM